MGLRVPMGPLSMGPLLHLCGSWVGFLWLLLGSCCVWGGMKGRCLRPLTPGPTPRPPPAVPRRRRRAVPAQFRSVAAGGAAERRAPRNGRSEIAAALRRAARGRLRVQRAALEAGHGVATPTLRRSSTWPRPHPRRFFCVGAWSRSDPVRDGRGFAQRGVACVGHAPSITARFGVKCVGFGNKWFAFLDF